MVQSVECQQVGQAERWDMFGRTEKLSQRHRACTCLVHVPFPCTNGIVFERGLAAIGRLVTRYQQQESGAIYNAAWLRSVGSVGRPVAAENIYIYSFH